MTVNSAAVSLLTVWAGMFTDNCSEYDVADLYEHYTQFALLFHGGWPVVPLHSFKNFVASQSPMGLHDREDTEALIGRLAVSYRPLYETHMCLICQLPTSCTGYYRLDASGNDQWIETCEDCMFQLDRVNVLATMSPIEKSFWTAHQQLALPQLTGLVPQHPIGRYFADFALPDQKISIELDGFATHSSTADIANDRKRQREIEALGWRVIRFGGQEVHRNAGACVLQAAEQVSTFSRRGT